MGDSLGAWQSLAARVPKLLKHPIFLIALAVKLVIAATFGADGLVRGVLPVVHAFATTWVDPYTPFLGQETLELAYPLSLLMLIILALPYALAAGSWASLLLLKSPLIIADIGVLLILSRLLRTKDRELLTYYWCSPIILYVTYFQGQLDIIPISLLMLALLAIFEEREFLGTLLLGAGTAAKSNILVALPFVFLYLWRRRVRMERLAAYAVVIATMFWASLLALRSSEGFEQMLSYASAEIRDFVLSSSLTIGSIAIYFVPLLLLLFALRLTYYRNMNRDALLMSLAVAFIMLVILVPPKSGWFLWSYPFIVYFFVKEKRISTKHLWLYTMAFFAYFALASPQSDLFRAFLPVSPEVAALGAPIALVTLPSAALITSLAFTALVGTMIVNAWWIYRYGLITRFEQDRPLFIGIAGDSGSGKSTTVQLLREMLGDRRSTVLEGDDLHRWERASPEWRRRTHLDPRANLLHEDTKAMRSLQERRIRRRRYDHLTGKFTAPQQVETARYVIASGLHTFYLQQTRERLNLKIFLDPDPGLQYHWKAQRDIAQRGYTAAQVRKQISNRAQDRKRHIEPQRRFADIVVKFSPVRRIAQRKVWDPSFTPEVKVEFKMMNSLDMTYLVERLASVRTLSVSHEMGLKLQRLTVRGTLARERARDIALALLEESDEMREHPLALREHLDAIVQLVLLRAILEVQG